MRDRKASLGKLIDKLIREATPSRWWSWGPGPGGHAGGRRADWVWCFCRVSLLQHHFWTPDPGPGRAPLISSPAQSRAGLPVFDRARTSTDERVETACPTCRPFNPLEELPPALQRTKSKSFYDFSGLRLICKSLSHVPNRKSRAILARAQIRWRVAAHLCFALDLSCLAVATRC